MQSARLLPFDPIVLVQDVLKRWLVVVLAALAVGIGTYIYTDATYAPVYRTTTTFVVTTRGSSTSVYSNLSSTSNLAGLFTELLNSSIMRKTILQETDISSFNGTIDTAVVPNTNLITMTVTDSDPRMAFLAAQAIIEHHESLTYQVIDDIGLEVLQYPAVPTSPTNQNFAFHQMKKAAVIAALAATALLAILSYLRDAVRSGTEVREKLDCSYLGEISHERKYKTVFALLRRKKTSILITNPVTSFRFVESIRKLRRRVEQHMDGGKVLMVTSLLENEGKSTVAVNLALAMEQKGKRVLLIDCDGQCNLTNFYKPGYDPDSDSNVATLLLGMAEPLWSDSAITLSPSMLLVPASSELYDIDCNALHEGMRRTRVLYDFVRAAEDDNGADYCILDCPPGYTVASVNALFACDEVIVPAKIDGFVFDGLESVRAQIRSLRRARPDVRIAGVLVTMRNSSEVVREGETLLRQRGIPVFEQVIRRTDKVVETTFEKKPLIDYCPRSVATQDYRRWVAEYLGEELGHGEV